MSQILKHPSLLLQRLKVPQVLLELTVVELKDRVVPFQSMPQSTQEELGKELFDDPLLSIDNVKKLVDYMQWSFKYTKVNLLLLLLAYVE